MRKQKVSLYLELLCVIVVFNVGSHSSGATEKKVGGFKFVEMVATEGFRV